MYVVQLFLLSQRDSRTRTRDEWRAGNSFHFLIITDPLSQMEIKKDSLLRSNPTLSYISVDPTHAANQPTNPCTARKNAFAQHQMCGQRMSKATFDSNHRWQRPHLIHARQRWSQIWFESKIFVKISHIWSTFDARHRRSQSCTTFDITYLISIWRASKVGSKLLIHLNSLLIRVKGICKGVTYLTYFWCASNVLSKMLLYLTSSLIRIKKRANPIFRAVLAWLLT